MTIEELIARAAAQPEVTVTRSISLHGAALSAEIRSRRYMTIAELQAHPDQHEEPRTFRYAHLLGAGLSKAEVAAWQASLPDHILPPDLAEALALVNGVHLWADLAGGRAYFGIAPLAEWQDAARVLWAGMYVVPPKASLVISYHENGDYYLVLDTLEGTYDWIDLEDFDNPQRVGSSFSEAITWLWDQSPELAPYE